jgi:hypothetical protein
MSNKKLNDTGAVCLTSSNNGLNGSASLRPNFFASDMHSFGVPAVTIFAEDLGQWQKPCHCVMINTLGIAQKTRFRGRKDGGTRDFCGMAESSRLASRFLRNSGGKNRASR